MQLRVNDQIRTDTILLIDENGKSLGQVSRDQALLLAYEKGLDLVEVGPTANPPVVKIVDYGKYLYEQAKKNRKAKLHLVQIRVKEIKLGFKIDEHDFETKVKQAVKFLKEGHKVRVSMTLRGRERAYTKDGIEKIEKFCQKTEAKFETPPKQLGNIISGIIICQR